jgi:8-oxo-dGTP pyrophosphatase MutT (NUDIX family)
MKGISAGVIILNSKNQILGCRAYGKNGQFDIPKGKLNEGETTYEAVIRETMEETGLDISNLELEEIGFMPYNKEKNLHLYKCHHDIEDLSILSCTSYFLISEREYPEMDGYEWIDLENIDAKFYKSLAPVLKKVLNL